MPPPHPPTRWYHLIWYTARDRQLAGRTIEAVAGERAVNRACRRLGWSAEAARVAPRAIHVLVRTSRTLPPPRVARSVLDGTMVELHRTGLLLRRPRCLRLDTVWCAALPSAGTAARVRTYIRALKRRTGSNRKGTQ